MSHAASHALRVRTQLAVFQFIQYAVFSHSPQIVIGDGNVELPRALLNKY